MLIVRQVLIILLGMFCLQVLAAEVKVAVSSNFLWTVRQLIPDFEHKTGHQVLVSSGSTGVLYTQIHQGAPYEIFLAADAVRTKKLEKEGLAVPGTRFVYAIGRLVLIAGETSKLPVDIHNMDTDSINHFSMAKPLVAPYGAASVQALKAIGVWPVLESKVVWGENVNQALQFVISGNANMGMVSLSQVRALELDRPVNYSIIPAELYNPLNQEGVLLKNGINKPAAVAFLEFLKSWKVRDKIRSYGYEIEE